MKLKKLNTRGISHIIAPLLIVMLVAVTGTFVAVRSHAASNPYACANPRPTIQEGSTGSCVEFLQWQLTNVYHYTTHGIDGDFGPNTKAAVVDFQGHNGLTEDGIVGPLTWAKLVPGTPAAPYTVSGGPALVKGSGGALGEYLAIWGSETTGTVRDVGVPCSSTADLGNYAHDWCSDYRSGGVSPLFQVSNYVLGGSYSTTSVEIDYQWLNKASAGIVPTAGDQFSANIFNDNGTHNVGAVRVTGVGNSGDCRDSIPGDCIGYQTIDLPNGTPINGLRIALNHVAAPNSNGDILAVSGVILYIQ